MDLERRGTPESAALAGTPEKLVRLMLQSVSLEAVEEQRREAFAAIGLEIERNLGDPEFHLDQLCRGLGVSSPYVQRVLERQQTTFSAVLRQKRAAFALALLERSEEMIEGVAFRSGYSDLSAFYRAFRREFGRSPGSVRKRATSAGGDF